MPLSGSSAYGLSVRSDSSSRPIDQYSNFTVRCFEIAPEDVGLSRVKPEALRGGDAEANADALRAVLEGLKGPYRDVAVLNAAAALVVAARPAPPDCAAMVVDRPRLAAQGALALTRRGDGFSIQAVKARGTDRPWSPATAGDSVGISRSDGGGIGVDIHPDSAVITSDGV